MSKKYSKFIQLGVVGIWLCLVSVLLYKHFISGVEFTPLQSLSADQFKTSNEWFGIYFKGEKIGHMNISSEKIGDEYRFAQSVESDMQAGDKQIHRSTVFKCLTDSEFRMKSFEFEGRTEGNLLKARGELDEENMLVAFLEAGGRKKTHAEKMEEQVYCPLTVKQALFAQGLEKGKRFSVPVFNIMTMKTEKTIVEVQELIPVKLGINVSTAYKLKMGETLSWLSSRGSTIKEQDSSGLVYFSETESIARSKERNLIFDYLSLPVQQSTKNLPWPQYLSNIKIRLSGLDLSGYPLLNEGRQVLNGDVIEISKENIEIMKESTYDLPYKDKDLEQFLAPTAFVQSDHHTIIYNSRKFAAIEKTAFSLARFLTSNLYLTVAKRPLAQVPTSMDAFHSAAGESNEHTVLFTAFTRAAGLPTRMVGGLVYRYGHFYYHTWTEVWLKQWVPADPTMGQFPADVTHIRFIEGDIDKLASLGETIGKIKIDIISEMMGEL
jgi:hypothetical protein